MFMPCHFTTACYLFSLWVPDKSRAEEAFNISVHFMFFTWLAIALPDHRGLTQFGEVLNFWVHHWVLLLIPLYWIGSGHFVVRQPLHDRHRYFKLAISAALLVHFDVMAMAALNSGHNVRSVVDLRLLIGCYVFACSYMLRPPPKTPFTGTWFRWAHIALLIFSGWFCGYILPPLIVRLTTLLQHRWLSRTFPRNTLTEFEGTSGHSNAEGTNIVATDTKTSFNQNVTKSRKSRLTKQ